MTAVPLVYGYDRLNCHVPQLRTQRNVEVLTSDAGDSDLILK